VRGWELVCPRPIGRGRSCPARPRWLFGRKSRRRIADIACATLASTPAVHHVSIRRADRDARDRVRWFDHLAKAPVHLGNPPVIEGNGVTHLAYQVSTRP
jgi:hypothetical protein